jgi:hypothetical protein
MTGRRDALEIRPSVGRRASRARRRRIRARLRLAGLRRRRQPNPLR